jgi:pimeloyl-ACP methyl ester carboxylesterase
MPFLIPHMTNDRLELHLRDLRRYQRNENEIAEHTRQMLKMPLRSAAESGRPVLLIAHSMGSVIAWDSLWQMSRNDRDQVHIDTLLTMGSPLGQRFVQRRLQGYHEVGDNRCPGGIGRWINLAAVGDLTAVDPVLADDFKSMVECGLVSSIEDHELHNYFRLDGALNVHAEYGYLANSVTAGIVADWWTSVRKPQYSAE